MRWVLGTVFVLAGITLALAARPLAEHVTESNAALLRKDLASTKSTWGRWNLGVFYMVGTLLVVMGAVTLSVVVEPA